MKVVLGWVIAGVAVPVGLLLLSFLPMAIATGLDQFVASLGMLLLAIVMAASPGALVGLLIGILDVLLSRYAAAGQPGPPVRAVVATAIMLVALIGATNLVLLFTASGGLSALQYLAIGLSVAAVPAFVAARRYFAAARHQRNATSTA